MGSHAATVPSVHDLVGAPAKPRGNFQSANRRFCPRSTMGCCGSKSETHSTSCEPLLTTPNAASTTDNASNIVDADKSENGEILQEVLVETGVNIEHDVKAERSNFGAAETTIHSNCKKAGVKAVQPPPCKSSEQAQHTAPELAQLETAREQQLQSVQGNSQQCEPGEKTAKSVQVTAMAPNAARFSARTKAGHKANHAPAAHLEEMSPRRSSKPPPAAPEWDEASGRWVDAHACPQNDGHTASSTYIDASEVMAKSGDAGVLRGGDGSGDTGGGNGGGNDGSDNRVGCRRGITSAARSSASTRAAATSTR